MAKFILSGFADEISDRLEEQITTLKKLGIHYVEMRGVNGRNLTDYSLEDAREIKKTLDKSGIRLSAVGSPLGKIGIEDDFEPHFVKFRHTLELAKIMETGYIRMFSFFIPRGKDADSCKDEVLYRWGRFAETAAGSGVTLLHENEKDIYGDIPRRCKTLLDAMDSHTVRGIFDPANFVQCRADTLEGFRLLADDTVYLHIKDAVWDTGKVVPSGEGDGHLPEILSELAARNFEGFLSLEPHLETGDIAVCGADKFTIAHAALTKILEKLDAEIA